MDSRCIHFNPARPRLELRDSDKPELYRDIFPYTRVGRIAFDDSFIMPRPPKDMFITDTTFRDGQQARPPYTVEQISTMFDLMHKVAGRSGLIRQSEFFLYSDKDRRAVEKCLEKGYRYPEITGWIRAAAKDLDLVKSMGLKETGMLTSVSDYHIHMKLGKTRAQALKDYLAVVDRALEFGIVPRCHFEDITRADIYGFCVPFATELMKKSSQSGLPIKIRLCDTMGYGVPYPGAALPRSVGKIVRLFTDEAGVPSEWLEWHGHNDFHKALVNAVTAWLYGCSGANATLMGFGERTGNTPVEGLIFEYIALTGEDDAADTQVVTDIARYFQKELKHEIPSNYPFVGRDFNATSAGIHVDGLLKNEEIYNIFDTRLLLNRPVPITITDKSGKAGVAYWINTNLDIPEELKVDKRHPAVGKIYEKIMKAYAQGRTTNFSHEEMKSIVARYMPSLFSSTFDRLKALAHTISANLIRKLSEHPKIISLRPEEASEIMARVLDEYPFIQYVYLIDQTGHPISWQVSHPEDLPKYRALGPNPSFEDREWFQVPMKNGKLHITDFYKSYLTGKLCLTVSVPVFDPNDVIQAVLGADIRFEELAKIQENMDDDAQDPELV
ncbi:MAG: histone-lysine N-methyltransferase [Deltaproteobacteria bacterium]|nr:histone-lysine N-methyltransferase [Deltaproteobacteria bacterium]